MALDDSALLEMIEMFRTADGGDLMRRLLGAMLQAGVDAEATVHIGADRHERIEDRATQCNGTRDRTVTTAAGDLTVRIGEGPHRVVLSSTARPPPAYRRGAARGRDGGLRRRRLNPPRR